MRTVCTLNLESIIHNLELRIENMDPNYYPQEIETKGKKCFDSKARHRSVTRRDFLQAGGAAVLSAGFSPVVSAAGQRGEAPQTGSLKAVEKAGEKHLLWQPRADLTVHLL